MPVVRAFLVLALGLLACEGHRPRYCHGAPDYRACWCSRAAEENDAWGLRAGDCLADGGVAR